MLRRKLDRPIGITLRRARPMLLALLLVAAAPPQGGGVLPALRDADMQLATIGYRLATANAALCDRLEPATGLQLHTLDQYPAAMQPELRRVFGFASTVGVEGVVAGSPAEAAGIRANDSLTRLAAEAVPAQRPEGEPNTRRLVALHAMLADLPPAAPIAVEGLRAGEALQASIRPVPACRTRFELREANDFDAQADGTMVQLSTRFLAEYSDEEVAAVVAHEFAHNILRHRARLEARGVSWGLLSGFGRNLKYFRQTEIEADLLSVYLLANAGYDPRAAVRFWEKFGPRSPAGIFRSRSHPPWRERVGTLEREAAKAAAGTRPVVPALLQARDRPLDGEWQALVAGQR